ncbi:hypothetical protein JCM17039_09540 [Blautia glucerasea]
MWKKGAEIFLNFPASVMDLYDPDRGVAKKKLFQTLKIWAEQFVGFCRNILISFLWNSLTSENLCAILIV